MDISASERVHNERFLERILEGRVERYIDEQELSVELISND
jgi:hypothetical protein